MNHYNYKVYLVGGALRDALLGNVAADRDYVVVGATVEQMLRQGFLLVGKDFPVFLHPVSKEEYALARTEKKNGHGYSNFIVYANPDVTLEQDLARRDLTINALALPLPDQFDDKSITEILLNHDLRHMIIDPFGGINDLDHQLFKHVSPAFAEDPVRILRLARLACKYPEFNPAPSTVAFMAQMVDDGEVDYLTAERIWQELAKVLDLYQPARFFMILRQCGALARVLPELDAIFIQPNNAATATAPFDFSRTIDDVFANALQRKLILVEKYILLAIMIRQFYQANIVNANEAIKAAVEAADSLNKRLKVPRMFSECSLMCLKYGEALLAALAARAAEPIVKLLLSCDALRRSERFWTMINALECAENCRLTSNAHNINNTNNNVKPVDRYLLTQITHLLQTLDLTDIIAQHDNNTINNAILQKRIEAVHHFLMNELMQ